MCSSTEEASPSLFVLKDTVNKSCFKCGDNAVTVARTKDSFCRECFRAYFTHRFRATFGRAKIVRQGEKVLVAVSGGVSSRVLQQLVEEGLAKDVYKKLRFIPSLIYIDEGACMGLSECERDALSSQVLDICRKSDFPVYFSRLEQLLGSCTVHLVGSSNPPVALASSSASLDDDLSDLNSSTMTSVLIRSEEERSLSVKLHKLFESADSVTAQESLLVCLRRQLLDKIANKIGFSKVLLGDNATRLSVRLLGYIAQGRGDTLPLDSTFSDDRSTIPFLRPLREFPSSEVASYAALCGLDSVAVPHPSSLLSSKVSIEKLTESFIIGLQAEFPSTINTIFRTGDKLSVNQDRGSAISCVLCQAPACGSVQTDHNATHLANMPDHLKSQEGRAMWDQLCYGCKLTVKEVRGGVSDYLQFLRPATSQRRIPRVGIEAAIEDDVTTEHSSLN